MKNASVYAVYRLTKLYPKQDAPANDDISFSVETGEIFGLLGDNGAGKSTLVRQMANLLRPTSGSVMLLGQPVQDDPLNLHPLALLVVPLCALPLAGVGALIGVRFRTPEEATSVGRLLTILMLTMGPALIPADRLPDWLVWLGFLSPATYAASALRQALLGPLTNRLLLDVAALLLFIFLSFWMVNRRMDWRER